MKILFDIQQKYEEPELHICSREKNGEVVALKEALDELLMAKITLHRNQESKAVGLFAIVRIYAENKKVYARVGGETYEVRDRLYNLETKLKDKGFVRISNSEIVNVSLIEKLDMGYAGTIKIYMKNGDETYVSRRYVKTIKEELK